MQAVIDAEVLVSALIKRHGTTGQVFRALRDRRFQAAYTTEMLIEIIAILGREKFRSRYHIQPEDVIALINFIRLRGELVIPAQRVRVRSDPKDNIFLEAALEANADCIVSGDAHLLELGSFEGIINLKVSAFLVRF